MSTQKSPDPIQVVLAALLDKFKVKHPALFIGIQLGLLTIAYFLMQCEQYGICLQPIFKTVATWIDYVLIVLVSPRTSSIISAYSVPKKAE